MNRKEKIAITVVALVVSIGGAIQLAVSVLIPLWHDISYDVREHRDVPFVLIRLNDSDQRSNWRSTLSPTLITNRGDILTLWKSRKLLALERAEWIPRSKLPELTCIGEVAYPQLCNHSVEMHCSCKDGYAQHANIVQYIFTDGTVCVGDKFGADWPFALIRMPAYRDAFLSLCKNHGLNPDKKKRSDPEGPS
jgi:hypothetical protein